MVGLPVAMDLLTPELKRQTKAWVRDTLAVSLHRLGVTRPDRIAAGKLSIATFHRVLPEELRRQYPFPNLAVTPEELSWFLGYFRRWFRVGSLAESLREFRSGSRSDRMLLAV